jgi:hypothetical protein
VDIRNCEISRGIHRDFFLFKHRSGFQKLRLS